jgi:hypothetical protein
MDQRMDFAKLRCFFGKLDSLASSEKAVAYYLNTKNAE